MEKNNKNNRFNNILKDLSDNDSKKVLTAISQLRKHGKKEAIIPLIKTYSSSASDEIRQEIVSLFYDLKDQAVVEEIIIAIADEQFIEERSLLVSIFWQSALDGSDYLSDFVRAAIHSDYLTCLEALTVIENFDSTFDENEIDDLKYDLDEVIDSEETEKAKLLASIKLALEGLNVEY